MKKISIIGAGKLGTVLGRALTRSGNRIKALSCRHLTGALESQEIIGEGKALTDNLQASKEGEVIFITAGDDRITPMAEELSGQGINWSGKTIFHCSGILPASELLPLKNQGAAIGSFHPVQTFISKEQESASFFGIYIAIEGDTEAMKTARELIAGLKAHPLSIDPDIKPLYHSACSIASNSFVALLDTALEVLKAAGFNPDHGTQILGPLVQGTLQNVNKFGIQDALSGPVIRGDIRTIGIHLSALEKRPELKEIYTQMSLRALEITRGRGLLDRDQIRKIQDLLEGK